MKKFLGLLILFSFIAVGAQAQTLKGKLDFLKNQEKVNIIFDFSSFKIDGDPIGEYVEERTENKSEEDAAEWIAEWEGSARVDFKEKYIKYCNDELKRLEVGVFPEAEYTIVVKIDDIDPGNFAGPFSNPAKIKSTVSFLKTGEETVLATISKNKDYNNYFLSPVEFHRIGGGFGEAGKMLAKFLNKKVK